MFPTRIEQIEIEGFEYLYTQDRCNQNSLPTHSAVYLLVNHNANHYDNIEVVYVGKTNNIASRLKYPHPIEKKFGTYLSAYVLQTNEHDELESLFIKRYNPKFNIHHNG